MSRKPSSSLSSASFIKQQSILAATSGTRKLKILSQMISELQKERNEYIKMNQHLIQITQVFYDENKILADAIESRKSYFDKLPDKIMQSEKTVQKQFELNQKMSRIYCYYKSRFNDAEKTGKKVKNDSEDETKKIDLKIDDIEKSAKFLKNKFSESEKKVNDYKVLLSLYSKLVNINNLLTKQAKNCFSKSTRLQKKIENGNAIKKKLFILDEKEEKEKINETKIALNDITNDLDRCLSIYSQIFLIRKRRMLMNKENIEEDSRSLNANENAVCRQIFSFDDEIEELSRIVGAKQFNYLNGTECEEKYRRIQNLFSHGQYPVYDSEETTDSEKENDEYLEEEQPEQNLEEESENDEENDRQIQKDENEQLDNVSKQEKGNKKVKNRKKHLKRHLRNLKTLKQDVSVQARMSIGSTTAKQQQEKIEATTQVSGGLSRSFLRNQSKERNAKQCKYTIGNELIMEFLLKELVGESSKEISEKVHDEEKTEKVHDAQVPKNVLKPFFTNPGEFLLEELEGETDDDESDRNNYLEFYSDSYNLDESTNSAYFEVEEPQNSYNESNKKCTLGNEFLSEISFGGDESEKVNNKVEYADNVEQEKKEEVEKTSKYRQQLDPKSTEKIVPKYQLSKIEPQSVNNKAKEPEKTSQTKVAQTILTNTKPIPKEVTASKNQLNRLEKACKSNQTEKVNNEKMNAKTDKLIKTKQTIKDRPKPNTKPNIKDIEEEEYEYEEEDETEFESLSDKIKRARVPFSQLIHILKGMQQPDAQMDESATEKCSSFECSPKKIDKDPRKINKTEELNMPEQKADLEPKQKDRPVITKKLFSLLDLEETSEAPKSPKEFTETHKPEPTIIAAKSNQHEQPKQIKLPQQLSSNSSRSITTNPSRNQSLHETELNLKNTKVDNDKTEKTNNVNQLEKIQNIELNAKAKQPKKAKQNKTSRSFFVHKVKDRKQTETKTRSQSPEKEEENDSIDELEKAKQTRIPLTQLVDVLKALHQSGVKIGENEAEEKAILEILSSETEESEKAIRTEKFILGKVPELTTSSESEQQEKAEALSLLELEEFSEAPKTPKENIKAHKFEQNEITKSNKLEKPKQANASRPTSSNASSSILVHQHNERPQSETKLTQQISKSSTLSKTLPSSNIKSSPKSIEKNTPEHQLNGLEKTYKLSLPEKVENEKANVKTEKIVKAKKAKKSQSSLNYPPKNRMNIKSNSKNTNDLDSECQSNEFESSSEKIKQARIPLSQLVDILKALQGENEAEENNELEHLTSETEEESEKAIRTEKFILGSVPELTTSTESEQPEKSPLFDLETRKYQPTATAKLNQSEQQKHVVHLPKGSPQLSARQNKNSKEKRESFEYLTSETESESEKAIRTEKFILGKVPELTTSSESEQQEKAEALSLLELEEFSEAPKTPKENIKTHKFEQNEITKSNKLEKPKQANASRPTSSNASSSILVHQHNERPQSETKIYKLKIEDELVSDSKSTKKEPNQNNDKKASPKFPVHLPKAKKPARKSTYDRSIFYTPMNTFSSLDDECSNNDNKVQITVTLKDIGLEGLDSFKPEKTKNENENSKKAVCKFDHFNAPSSTRNGRSASASSNAKSKAKTKTKQASLLDSTQKAQKYQAIKPKTTSKYASKYNENNRTNAANHNSLINKCSQDDRSPKSFYNEMTERLPTVLNYNYALPI